MEKMLVWDFASTGGSPDDGIHNSMIEHFAGNYNYHLAREIIQNSLDAKIDGVKTPVTVEFKLEFFKAADFPGHSDFGEVLKRCEEYWIDEDTHQFVKGAKACLANNEIPFLRISDFNTKGLTGGDYQKDGTWYKLVKSRGSSSKSGGEGGSFGIGKGAPFAASNLRVVFYSTKNEQAFSIFQGIAELVSFSKNGDVKRGVGSLGDGQHSLRGNAKIPEKFWRKKTGTDIYIAGYKNNNGWEIDLIKSVLRNFWFAIFKNELIVKIEDHVIDGPNLERYLTQFFSNEKFRDDVEPIGNPLQYYLTVRRGSAFSKTLPELGNVTFYFQEIEEFLNHVAMMRKSHMVISSRLFRFPGNYAGVFICDNDKGNQELRKMEPPAHDKWIIERNPEKGKRVYDELSDFIKDCLAQSKVNKKSEILDIPDMYKYLPDNEDAEQEGNNSGKAYTGEEGSEETAQQIQRTETNETPVTISPQKITVINKRETGKDNDDHENQPSDPERIKPRKPRKKHVSNVHLRAFNIGYNKSNEFKYQIVIKSPKTGKYDMKLYLMGEDLMEKLNLSSVSLINNQRHFHSGNIIKGIQIQKNVETRFTIEFGSPFKCALKIDLNEI